MGSAPSYAHVAPEFTDLQHLHDEPIRANPKREHSRRKTMKAVLASLGKEASNGVDYIMSDYTQWLLTVNKTNKNGRPMNRWDLMTSFVETQLII